MKPDSLGQQDRCQGQPWLHEPRAYFLWAGWGGPAHRPLLRREKSKACPMHAPGLTSGGETRKTRLWCPVGSLGQSKVWTQTTPETGESNFSISHKHFFDSLLDAGSGEGEKKKTLWLLETPFLPWRLESSDINLILNHSDLGQPLCLTYLYLFPLEFLFTSIIY